MFTPKLFKIHLNAMKEQLLSLSKVRRGGRILGDSPFRRIPSVSKYEVISKPYNLILEKIGIKLRLPRQAKGIAIPENEKMNRYMARTLTRIRNYVSAGDYERAGVLAKLNIRYSKSFRMSAFNFICKGGYYNMAQSEVGKLNRKVERIISQERANLDYKRVYILKTNGKGRPLGVPALEGRIVLHLINGFFVEVLKGQLHESQHAYIPGKGTMTAGRDTITKALGSSYIYETDLKGFFNEVSVGKILDMLHATKSNYSDWIMKLCESKPKLPEEELMDESKFKRPSGLGNLLPPKNSVARVTGGYSKTVDGVTVATPPKNDALGREYNDYVGSDLESKGLKGRLDFENYGLVPGGVPQGSPMSPFLSILALKAYLAQADSSNYADDQNFFSSRDFVIKDFPDNGIVHSTEKCKGVMKDNIGLQNGLKFLGFRLLPNWAGISETRNGVSTGIYPLLQNMYSNLGLRKLDSIKCMTDVDNYSDGLVNKSPESVEFNKEILLNLSKRRIFGFVMSCMQINDWKNDHAAEDQEKAMKMFLSRIHKKALVTRIPKNTDSSFSIPFLSHVTNATMVRKTRQIKKRKLK